MLTFLWYPKLNLSPFWGPATAIFQPTTDCISLVHETIFLPCIISCATLWYSTERVTLCVHHCPPMSVIRTALNINESPTAPHLGKLPHDRMLCSWGQRNCALSHLCHPLPSSRYVRQLKLLGKIGLESFLMKNGNCFPMKSLQQNALFPH